MILLGLCVQSGALNGQSLGWCRGQEQWCALADLSSLADVFPPIELPAHLIKSGKDNNVTGNEETDLNSMFRVMQ